MDNKEFNLFDDSRNIVVSEDTCKIIKLMVIMGEIRGRIYDLVGDFYGEKSVDDMFEKSFSDSFFNINDNLAKLLQYYVVNSLMSQDNVTEDSIRI